MVEGIASAARGSGSTAARSACATALNAASAMWWLFTPSSFATLRVMPPFIATALKNSRTSSVSKLPIFALGKSTLPDQERPPREVERRPHQRVVHRQMAGAVAPDAALVPQRLRQRPPEGDADVLDGVVVVDVQVALGRAPSGRSARAGRAGRACGRRSRRRWRSRARPLPSRSTRTESVVSAVVRLISARAHGGPPRH